MSNRATGVIFIGITAFYYGDLCFRGRGIVAGF